MKQFDYLVLGSGIAGLSFALKLSHRAARTRRLLYLLARHD
jgi:protoporphyrinogen oxidase